MFSRLKRFNFLLKPFLFFRKVCLITGVIFWSFIAILLIALILIINSIPPIETMNMSDLKKISIEKLTRKDPKNVINYKWTRIDKINRGLLWSVVLSEDSTFFKHQGVNVDAMYNALADNLKKKKIAYGASTITQQVAKNLFLSNDRSFVRKIKEFFITKALEKRFKKNEILEVYLNIAEFGPHLFGVYKGAGYYFKKKPSKINAAEGSFMALFLPSPRKYHYSIFKNHYLSRKHRRKIRRILRDMSYMELISPVQYRKYLNYNYF